MPRLSVYLVVCRIICNTPSFFFKFIIGTKINKKKNNNNTWPVWNIVYLLKYIIQFKIIFGLVHL